MFVHHMRLGTRISELWSLGSELGPLEEHASTLASESPLSEGYVAQCYSTLGPNPAAVPSGACGSADLQAHPCYLRAPRVSSAPLGSHCLNSDMCPREPDSEKLCFLYYTSGKCKRPACQAAHARRVIGILHHSSLRSKITGFLP